jgi:hypothetical protein
VKDYNEFVAQFTASRVLFCSGEDLKDFDTNFLIEFFKINGIEEVIVDGGQDATTYLRYAALLDGAVGSDLKVRFLVDPIKGSVSLAGDLASLIQLSLTPMIHFDLMSILKDPTNREYQEILETVDLYSGSYNISLSAPIITDTTLLQSLKPLISKLHLFSVDSEQLVGSSKNVARDRLRQYGQKLDLVVNPQDFGSKMEMDQFINQLSEDLQLTSIGISSMTNLIGLDKKTVGWHEERRF